jgi:hypothetical protein
LGATGDYPVVAVAYVFVVIVCKQIVDPYLPANTKSLALVTLCVEAIFTEIFERD